MKKCDRIDKHTGEKQMNGKNLFQRFFHQFPSKIELHELAEKRADETISAMKSAMDSVMKKPIICHVVMAEDKKHDILSYDAVQKLYKVADMLLKNNSEIKTITNFDSPTIEGTAKQ